MAEQTVQTRANHARLHPLYHFFTLPALLALLVWTIINLVRFPGFGSAQQFLIVLVLIVMNLNLRMYALRVQDRLIRLEERLRLERLSPDGARLGTQLDEGQLIALRFASDAELPALAERAARERLTGKQIKDAIREWRPDNWRV